MSNFQTTVVWGLRILMTLLSLPNLLHKFRLGTCNGHWLIKSEIVLQNKMIQALGQVSLPFDEFFTHVAKASLVVESN